MLENKVCMTGNIKAPMLANLSINLFYVTCFCFVF
jgi:hypothetical protein